MRQQGHQEICALGVCAIAGMKSMSLIQISGPATRDHADAFTARRLPPKPKGNSLATGSLGPTKLARHGAAGVR